MIVAIDYIILTLSFSALLFDRGKTDTLRHTVVLIAVALVTSAPQQRFSKGHGFSYMSILAIT